MKKLFKKNEIYTVRIEDITDLGFGVGHIEGCAIFVADTVMGDLVRVSIIKVNSGYLVGRMIELIEASEARCTSRCTESGCRSCAYKNISYSDEALKKEEGVRRLFSRRELSVPVAKIITSPAETRYRNKAQYPIARVGGRYTVGFYAPKSHRVCPIEDCPLTPEVFSEIVALCLSHFEKHSLSVYNEESGEGLLRHIYLRRGEVTGEILLTIVVTSFAFPHADELVASVRERFPQVVGILLNKNSEATNVILGDEYKTLYGVPYIFDVLAGVRLKITAQSFYQVNRTACELLYAKARDLAAPTKADTVLDLYCGAGSIGLSMARDAGEVIGIEIVESAVECAKENAVANGITNASFFTGDAANTERLLEAAERKIGKRIDPDVVILDPPRAGCAPELLSFVASREPKRIVYISCNPKTLARDAELLAALGYKADTVYPVDMFPMTGHVESVVCLTR
ncbi:MAG: 23S rRNA (uracil(1939)-C(5))-methyltransferase RlmD [Clostridia bacterium]|nr:23S rRNA (uracil(1939)-C(5))-methyltransferase RlmD [Clostridia bacterium]